MQIVRSTEAPKFVNSNTTSGRAAKFDGAPMDGALITVDGRYPDTGYVMNEVCHELAFVVDGSGSISTLDNTIEFAKGDSIYIKTHERYYWSGNFQIYTVCTPAFHPEQHKHVE